MSPEEDRLPRSRSGRCTCTRGPPPRPGSSPAGLSEGNDDRDYVKRVLRSYLSNPELGVDVPGGAVGVLPLRRGHVFRAEFVASAKIIILVTSLAISH